MYLIADRVPGYGLLVKEPKGGGTATLREAWAAVNPGVANVAILREQPGGDLTVIARRGMGGPWERADGTPLRRRRCA